MMLDEIEEMGLWLGGVAAIATNCLMRFVLLSRLPNENSWRLKPTYQW